MSLKANEASLEQGSNLRGFEAGIFSLNSTCFLDATYLLIDWEFEE